MSAKGDFESTTTSTMGRLCRKRVHNGRRDVAERLGLRYVAFHPNYIFPTLATRVLGQTTVLTGTRTGKQAARRQLVQPFLYFSPAYKSYPITGDIRPLFAPVKFKRSTLTVYHGRLTRQIVRLVRTGTSCRLGPSVARPLLTPVILGPSRHVSRHPRKDSK
jgi:hypothetical protein